VAFDRSGNLFIAEAGHVRKVTPDGLISTVAGNGIAGFSGDGGPATSARLSAAGVAVDSSGNLFIADSDNHRVRKVTPDGLISTVAGNGIGGFNGDGVLATFAQLNTPSAVAVDGSGNLFINEYQRIREVTRARGLISTVVGNELSYFTTFSGDGGPAASAQIYRASGVAVDGSGNLFIADTGNHRIRKVTFTQQATFSIADRGGVSLRSFGTLPNTVAGYATIQPSSGSTTAAGLAIFGFRQNNILITEAGVPATPLIQSGRIYAEVSGSVNTGLAMANPNNQPAVVSFFFTDQNGDFGQGNTTIPANGQIAAFLNQSPFNGGSSVNGALTFNSSVPISAIALRGLTNEREEFLITTLPVADLTASATTDTMVLPHFADGGGWTTEIILFNPTDNLLTGTVQFLDQGGGALGLSVNGQFNTTFNYTIPARTSQVLQTSGDAQVITSGSVRVVPDVNTTAPSALAIFSYRNNGTTVAQAAIPAVPVGSAFRLYVEAAGDFASGAAGSIQTGLAVANTSADTAIVTLELSKLDGSSVGLTGTLSIPANGQTAIFLNQIPEFGSLPTPFQGVLRVSSSASFAVTGLRGRYNERNDFLITTTPPVNEATAASTSTLFLPHIADSGGYTTQFILFSAQPGLSSSGTIQFLSRSGGAWNVPLQ
jgi:hypothetical protein